MNALEHFREAERLLTEADDVYYGSEAEVSLLAAAQVHATLALAGHAVGLS